MTSEVRIWGLQHTTVCKVIGMAFDFEDLRKIARKFQLCVDHEDGNEEFSLHSAIVGLCGRENKLARHAQKLIERRFAPYAKRLAATKPEELVGMVTGGPDEASIPLWAVLWHLAAHTNGKTEKVETALFGHIHMLEHQLLQSFWKQRACFCEPEAPRETAELLALKRELLDLRRVVGDLERTNRSLQLRVAGGEGTAASLRVGQRHQPHTDLRPAPSHYGKIRELKFLLEDERRKNRETQDQCSQYRKQLEAATAELLAMEKTMQLEHEPETCGCPCSAGGPCLRGHRIALVGGLDGLAEHYRGAVEQWGGEFCRHDGRCDGGMRSLEECICSASLVICPINVNSHFAATSVKRICRKRSITCCFPDSASLSCLRTTLHKHFSPAEPDHALLPDASS
jgi:hypothetical protein